ncbi:MAG: ATP synthase F1 subunit gamma [Planctomycetota bacterium]
MPNLKDIQRRITSVKKTQQITRAMRMVAGAKLRRAQDTSTAAKPYAERMRATLLEVARTQTQAGHPLLEVRDTVEKVEVIVVTSDRGLCGAFNSNLLKLASAVIEEREVAGAEVVITTAGKKARDFFRRRRPGQLGEDHPQAGWVTYGQATEIARGISERYAEGTIDEAVLIYSDFVSAMTQVPVRGTLLPFSSDGGGETDSPPYEIEPNAPALLSMLAPKAVEVEIYKALLENQTGEHAARMAAMESATRNTEELVDSLTLQFNRARQAAITRELVEIVSGAEAL